MRGRKTRILFHDLVYQRRLNDWIVGYERTGSFLTMEDLGVNIIRYLKHHSLEEAEQKFPSYNVREFIKVCKKAGLIHKIGHRVADHKRPITDFLSLPPEKIRFLTSPLAAGSFIGLALTGIILLLIDSRVLPRPTWLFTTGVIGIDLVLALIIYWVILLLHEIGHYLALQATGHKTGISIVSTWHYLVPYTDISNARFLHKKQRIGVYIAGLVADMALFSLSTILWVAGVAPFFFKLVSLLVFINILFEISPTRNSDLIRVLSQHYEVHDLLKNTWSYIKKSCPCTKDKITKEEERAAEALPALLFGFIVLLSVIIGYIIPIAIEILSASTKTLLAAALAKDAALYVDGMIALLLIIIFLSFMFIGMVRQHKAVRNSITTWFLVLLSVITGFAGAFILSVAMMIFFNALLAVIGLLITGFLTGVLFWDLIRSINIDDNPMMREYLMPLLVGLSTISLMFLLSITADSLGISAPTGIYSISFAAGIISSYFL